MTNRRRHPILVVCGLVIALAVPSVAVSQRPPADPEVLEAQERKKELLKLMEKLEVKLPPDLARKLIIISMKLSTGHCSPNLTRELAEEISRLPEKDRRKFAKEWDGVREHPEWPCKKFGPSSAPESAKPPAR